MPAAPTQCVTIDPRKLQESNHLFQQRKALPPAVARAAEPVRGRAASELERLTPAQRTSQADVRAALVAAGLPAGGIYVQEGYAGMTAAGTRVDEVAFGAFTAMSGPGPAVCLYGSTSAAAVTVNIGGNIMEGGCLPGPGGH